MRDVEDWYALTEYGRVLHTVRAALRWSADVAGRPALCGRRVARLVHPSDHYEGAARYCSRCERTAA